MYPFSVFCFLEVLAVHLVFTLLDPAVPDMSENPTEQQEPEQVVYYYQGKHPLCTMLIPDFSTLEFYKNSDTVACYFLNYL